MYAGQPGFWDVEERLRELTARGDPLEKLGATVDFEIFRADLEAALGPRDRSKGGRPGEPSEKLRLQPPTRRMSSARGKRQLSEVFMGILHRITLFKEFLT